MNDDDGDVEAFGDAYASDVGSSGVDPLAVGAAWAIGGHLIDRQTRQLQEAMTPPQAVMVNEPAPVLINSAEFQFEGPKKWDAFVGQERVKRQLAVRISSAKARETALDHILLASGMPGVGKTTLAHLIAKEMGAHMMKLVPPFHKDTLAQAVQELGDGDVLFIDEIDKMAEGGPRVAGNLLPIMEEARLFTDDGAIELDNFTVIGATTDGGKLPEAVLDRFMVKPIFEVYSTWDLANITAQFTGRYMADLDDEVIYAIAGACRSTPRVARELVLAGRDLALHYERSPTPAELFDFQQMDADGMTLSHKNYLLAVYHNFARKPSSGRGGTEYIAGEAALLTVMRETTRGLANIERFLLEMGYLDQTPQGRRLTEEGIQRARDYEARSQTR